MIGSIWLASLALVATVAPDAEAFRSEILSRLQTAHPAMTFSPGDEPLVISYRGGDADEGSLNLHQAFAYCQSASPVDCEEDKKKIVTMVVKTAPEASRENLRIVVRDQQYVDYLEEMRRRSEDKASLVHYRQVGDDLYALIAADGPQTIAMVGDKHLKELGMTVEEAWSLADRNTKAVLPPLPDPNRFKQEAIAFQDYEYLSALVSDLSYWGRVSETVGKDLFMTVVSDQFVFVGTMPDEGVAKFRATVEEDCAAQPRCVSPNIYRFRDGRWIVAR